MLNLDFRTIWMYLPLINKVFLLFFCCVLIYTLWLSFFALYRLRNFNKQRANDSGELNRLAFRNLGKRLGNLRQLHLFTLYFLWLCIVLSIPHAFETIGTSRTWPIGEYLRNLALLFHYYAPIFLAFLVLHSLQWLASSRMDLLDIDG